MGMLIEGKWVDDDAQYRTASSGAFVRPQSIFTHRVTADGSSGFKAEPGRYHLFLAPNCPWAHRTQIFRRLKRLENVISISLADLPRPIRRGSAATSTQSTGFSSCTRLTSWQFPTTLAA
jgi:putative glutathione S-transferase